MESSSRAIARGKSDATTQLLSALQKLRQTYESSREKYERKLEEQRVKYERELEEQREKYKRELDKANGKDHRTLDLNVAEIHHFFQKIVRERQTQGRDADDVENGCSAGVGEEAAVPDTRAS